MTACINTNGRTHYTDKTAPWAMRRLRGIWDSRFRNEFTSISPRCRIDLAMFSLRSHINFTSISHRFHTDLTSFSQQFHIALTTISHEFHNDFTTISHHFQIDLPLFVTLPHSSYSISLILYHSLSLSLTHSHSLSHILPLTLSFTMSSQ